MKIFLISDNHFDALKYPEFRKIFPRQEFKSNKEMNDAMIHRWNRVVSDDDLVISVGDFCWIDPRPWLNQLNGNKIMIRGNHDNQNNHDNWCKGYAEYAGDWYMMLEYKKMRFYVTHDPAYVPRDWKDWVIHGHHHCAVQKNGDLTPYINGLKKNINVACELVNYTPVWIDDIINTKNLETTVMMARTIQNTAR